MPENRAGIARRGIVAGFIAYAAFAAPLTAQVKGSVVNATTGGPAESVSLTLSSFRGGMTPIEEAVSGPDGRFEFTKQLPAAETGQPFAGAIRAEFEGIGYTEILRSDSLGEDVRITVYSVSATGVPSPANRVVILEPNGGELFVRDGYQFVTDSATPVTYSSEDGTLRFHLPAAARGDVEVSGTGPAGMPLRSTALPAGEPGIYKVDFPLKPGENRIDLAYTIPYEDGMEFTVRSVYPGVATRAATPEGVELGGAGVTPLGKEPTTKASIYTLPDTPEATVTVTGEGRLRTRAPAASSGQSDISIEPAPVASELPWIVGLALLIFGVGFVHLLGSKLPPGREKG